MIYKQKQTYLCYVKCSRWDISVRSKHCSTQYTHTLGFCLTDPLIQLTPG